MSAKRILHLTRLEFFFVLNFIMLGFVMYWTGIVVQPTLDILEQQQQEVEVSKAQIETVIENQDNNTALLVEMFDRQNKLLSNQITLVAKLTNATNTFQNTSKNIDEHVDEIIQESKTIGQMIAYFRENFGERFIVNETAVDRSAIDSILSNVTKFENEIVLFREELSELIDLLANRTTTALNFILPSAMASEDEDEEEEEDVVGDILEAEGVERNPPEINDSEEVASPDVVNTTGQISSFEEGPIVVVPP